MMSCNDDAMRPRSVLGGALEMLSVMLFHLYCIVLYFVNLSPVSTIAELWPVLTGNGNRSPVNSASGNRALTFDRFAWRYGLRVSRAVHPDAFSHSRDFGTEVRQSREWSRD